MRSLTENSPARSARATDNATDIADTILIVDDSPIDARIAANIIQKALGRKTIFAGNGVQALDVLALQQPALVLTDLSMPEMDGLELVERVRERHPQVPVVLMTARGSEAIAIEALKKGAASYVPKSVLQEQLAASLERIFGVTQGDRRRARFLEGVSHLNCRLSLENDESFIPVFIEHIQQYLLRMKLCDQNSLIRVGVALEEAMVNGMHHGNLELSSPLKEAGGDEYTREAKERKTRAPYRNRRLHVEVKLDPNEAVFVFRDEGPGFDVSQVPDPTDPENLLRPSGRGLLLIRLFMDAAYHNDRGNQITLIRRRR